MKGGKTPIHRQPWYPVDYHQDEHVRLLKARRDYRTLTFYRHFIDHAWTAGGDLPADPEVLAAVVEMPRKDVEAALSFCLGRLLVQEGDRLYQKRIRRDLAEEVEFRVLQSERGKKGGRPRKESGGFDPEKPVVLHRKSPPVPTPTPTPTPTSVERDGSRVPHEGIPEKPPLSDNGNGPDPDSPERLDPSGFWQAARTRLSGIIPAHAFATWFRPLETAWWDGPTFVIDVPDRQFAEWLRNTHEAQVRTALHEVGFDGDVQFRVRGRSPTTVHDGAL